MAALTLLEASKLMDGEVIRPAVIEMFARSSDILEVMPFLNVNGNAYRYNLEAALPGIAFRGVNEGYTTSPGVINPKVEPLLIAGGDLDVDTYIVRTEGVGVRSTHEALKIKALTEAITAKIIKGDSATDARELDGLQTRLTGTQVIDAGATSGGDALSLAKLDEAIDAVFNPTHLLMNRTMARRLSAAARNVNVGGYITYGLDAFGRRVIEYNGLRILTGYAANLNTAILPFSEANPGGGSNVGTSIYVLSLGDEGVVGLQNGTMDVRDLGELQTIPVFRTRVEWYIGMAILHGRAAARLRGIKDAAVVV